MTTELHPLSEAEQQAVISLCVLAAFADGNQSEVERTRIQQIVHGFSNEHLDLTEVYQKSLTGQTPLPEVVARLQSPNSKALAYEMAACVCNADDVLSPPEQQFLARLRQALGLDSGAAATLHDAAGALAREPLPTPPPLPTVAAADTESDRMILNYAILNGALELMPHSLATMAIVPLQMRLVYRIGKGYGYNLDR
ncbi:MAG: DUF533 domain-containing protein, partial [Verrucomicrobia bacterium]|nr:DUF533 domain-containing protein [Verrucomicrobiota bacterium]